MYHSDHNAQGRRETDPGRQGWQPPRSSRMHLVDGCLPKFVGFSEQTVWYSEYLEGSSEDSGANSEHFDAIHDKALLSLAEPVRSKGKAPRALVENTILALCTGRFLTLREIAELLQREPETARVYYVTPMLHSKLLEPRFPGQTHHPQQSYRTAGDP